MSEPTIPQLPAEVPAYSPAPHPAGRGWWANLPAASLTLVFLLFALEAWTSTEIAVEGMAITGLVLAVSIPLFWGGVGPWANRARRAPRATEHAIVNEFKLLGIPLKEVWVCPAPPLSPKWSPAIRAGRRVLVWAPLVSIPARELAGGVALRGSRIRGWPLGLSATILAALQWIVRPDAAVPAWLVPVCAAGVAAVAAHDVIVSAGARRRASMTDRAVASIRGALAIGRAHARWLATGFRGVGADVAFTTRAERTWERALRCALDVSEGARLGILPVQQEAIALVRPEPFEPRSRIV